MLGKCGQPNQANLLFELLRADGLEPTIDVYTALVGVYGFNGLLEDAFRTVDHMKSVSGCNPDVYTYTILIKCCVKLNRLDLIGRILAEMSQLGIECNTITYNTIIDGYGKAGVFELMEELLMDMIENNTCLPDVFTFNSVIAAYGNSGQIEKMQSWFDEFQLMGIKPDIVTFNILIKSYGKAGKYEKMGSVLDFMKKRFYSPTIVTYNTIIGIFGKAGIIDKMEETFMKMKHQGMKPNSRTYCSLVSAYGGAGLLNKVESIMRQVENSDVVLDTPFFNCVISVYGRAGDVGRMNELLHEMKKWKCKPDNITFSTMIQTYSALGMTEAAEDLDRKVFSVKENSGMPFLSLLLSIFFALLEVKQNKYCFCILSFELFVRIASLLLYLVSVAWILILWTFAQKQSCWDARNIDLYQHEAQ